MPLKLTLKSDERIIIGNAVITNGSKKCEFTINNNVTILREKDIITEDEALSPALRIYYVLQLMYMRGRFGDSTDLHPIYNALTNDFSNACADISITNIILDMGIMIMDDRFFQAMKLCKTLIAFEKEVMNPC